MEFSSERLLDSGSVTIQDIVCRSGCRHRSPEECTDATHLVFPYRGVYVRHVGRAEAVAEPNQVLFFNEGEEYRVSHPVEGGDACLSMVVAEPLLRELASKDIRREGAPAFRSHRRRIDAQAQTMAAELRYDLKRRSKETLKAETLALSLVERALGAGTSHAPRASYGRQKLADRAKLVMSSDFGRRWTLADIATEVGVSPVYLTQVFRQVEGMPLYRYQLRLRLARALDVLDRYDDIAQLGMDLGFSSHSHFTSTFRRTYGRTPAEFQRATRARTLQGR